MELKNCKDYHILKAELTNEQLDMIDKVIKHYIAYAEKYDDGKIDIIGNYTRLYGNDYVLNWYEGLMATEEFIAEVKNGNINEKFIENFLEITQI